MSEARASANLVRIAEGRDTDRDLVGTHPSLRSSTRAWNSAWEEAWDGYLEVWAEHDPVLWEGFWAAILTIGYLLCKTGFQEGGGAGVDLHVQSLNVDYRWTNSSNHLFDRRCFCSLGKGRWRSRPPRPPRRSRSQRPSRPPPPPRGRRGEREEARTRRGGRGGRRGSDGRC